MSNQIFQARRSIPIRSASSSQKRASSRPRTKVIEADDSDPTDDDFRSILTDRANKPIRRELAAFINAMDDDEKAELIALTWTGRGDYSAREWRVAVAEARSRREVETSVYLLGIPLLGDYLEDGLAEFGMSCDDFNDRELG